MKVVRLNSNHDYLIDPIDRAVCAVGFFDGIHKGHQQVIEQAKQIAKQTNAKLAVMTFSPHPSAVLNKGKHAVSYLTPLLEKQAILQKLGVDIVYVVKFDLELAQLSPEAFINHFIVDLNIFHLICGFDFTYGHMGKGNVTTLFDHANHRFDVTVIEKYSEDDQKVSSTRIRKLLAEGAVDQAETLLTRPLKTIGKVVHGHKRGRSIGFPTANMLVDLKQALPKTGVYYVVVEIDDQLVHGMANLGYNPTFDHEVVETTVKLEVHLLDFNKDLYGQEVALYWKRYLRPETKFDSIDSLIEQIKQDEAEIRQFF
ncbi:riboflavin kinase / FMN adenylyltransferase [Amphibacillus marinus]|uniref:Riboflavin biosynthesis protein n=1 Tax=Amphibacillus marinus TaxID=872970 RepID=A0A1H8HLF2_9BACI|nr:bifunctional riboflavin kinase/FAD synthetase [Amphibacillus marinus]SEN56979.1 riboflavin kinase / FMN adenylyltransferase [Amphibacillus marinus]